MQQIAALAVGLVLHDLPSSTAAVVPAATSPAATASTEKFYATTSDSGSKLPATEIYPNGRRLAFMGYSGEPARDLTNGFTVAGPVYGNQMPYLKNCFAHGWPVVAHVGPNITFNDKAPNKYKLNEAALRADVTRQVKELAPHAEIVWWAVHPEELRPWRKDEMRYLEILCDTIRTNDPARRPIFLYNPNHRDAGSLAPVARYLDVLGKGCYVNGTGKKNDRVWVRWSIEQEVRALKSAGRTNGIPLLMPELSSNPARTEFAMIPAWVRHDVYLGMVSGAKGVLIWSLFRRSGVKESWPLWYNSYAQCARELNGELALAQIFLFGEKKSALHIQPALKNTDTTALPLGGNAETNTTTEQERQTRAIQAKAWTAVEYAYMEARWLFLINSSPKETSFTLDGWPAGSRAEQAFTGKTVALPAEGTLKLDLQPWGVAAIRFSAIKP